MNRFSATLVFLPRLSAMALIRLYQQTLSPDHGFPRHLYPHGYCRFTPTCSEYGHEAIRTRGLTIGVAMSVWRILRCNPFSNGGFDPVK